MCLQVYPQVITCLALSPDGKWILSGSNSTTIGLWDFTTGESVPCFSGQGGHVSNISISNKQLLFQHGALIHIL